MRSSNYCSNNQILSKLVHGTKLKNHDFGSFSYQNGIDQNFFAPFTFQDNEVVERKSRILQDIARTILFECYVFNSILIRTKLDKTPHELYKKRKPTYWKERWKPNTSYFHSFESKCYIFRSFRDKIGNFDAKSD